MVKRKVKQPSNAVTRKPCGSKRLRRLSLLRNRDDRSIRQRNILKRNTMLVPTLSGTQVFQRTNIIHAHPTGLKCRRIRGGARLKVSTNQTVQIELDERVPALKQLGERRLQTLHIVLNGRGHEPLHLLLDRRIRNGTRLI